MWKVPPIMNASNHEEWIFMHCSDSMISATAVIQPFVQAQIKENTKPHLTGLYEGNSPATGEFPTQRASNAEIVFI